MARPRKKPVLKATHQIYKTNTQRIDECQKVLEHLEQCQQEVITRDLENNKKIIDDKHEEYTRG